MATINQRSYIKDLAVLKLKEFKEFKELVFSQKIVGLDSETVKNAQSVDEILNATTDFQASKIIEALIQKEIPKRSKVYSKNRAESTIALTNKILNKIGNWDFDELRRFS